jgi:hypothetical protein
MGHITTKIDWDAFSFIFSQNTRTAFQQLTDQLFCFEFNQPYGVYRYFNQWHIEAMPVSLGDDCIGYQAKYYDAVTTLQSKKDELISSIIGANETYPDLNRFIIYTNKEAGQSTKKGKTKPAYIEEIETKGSDLGITVEWRGLSQIETMLLQPEMELIRDFFFAMSGGLRRFISQISSHKETIFSSISSEIAYQGASLKIMRQSINLEDFLSSSRQILLIHGEGGCGKSALVKDQLGTINEFPIIAFRATDFNTASLSEFAHKYGDCTWDEFLSTCDGTKTKICVIDSGEKYFSIEHQNTFDAAIQLLRQHGWRLIITIRTNYMETFLNNVLRTFEVAEHIVSVPSADELAAFEKDNNLLLPFDAKLRDFLRNLFYLKLFLSEANIAASENIRAFLTNVWDKSICNSNHQKDSLNIRRGRQICTIVRSNADNGTSYYLSQSGDDYDAIASLVEDGIIKYDDAMDGYFLTHDVYEEIVLKHILTTEYNRKRSTDEFFLAIGDSLVMRKAFRIWLHDQLVDENERIADFLSDALVIEKDNSIWKDEILITLLSADNSEYTVHLDRALKEDGFKLYTRALGLLNTSCRIIDDTLLKQFLSVKEIRTNNVLRFTKPSGFGWKYLIAFSYKQRDSIPWSLQIGDRVTEVLYAWARNENTGETTRYAGLLALYLYKQSRCSEYLYRHNNEILLKIIDSVLCSAEEILPELASIFEEVINNKSLGHREPYSDLCNRLLSSAFNCGRMCVAAPDLVIRLAKCFWLEDTTKRERYYNLPRDNSDFGICEHMENDYFPASAFQTPIFYLLQAEPIKTIDFIIELIDTTTQIYKNSSLNNKYRECVEIEISFQNGDRIKQIASQRLWLIHRGTSVAPYLLQSVLMALEHWLYNWIGQASNEMACQVCMRILSKSHSVAMTAVIAGMVVAYPEKLFAVACVLISAKEIFHLDIIRVC